VAPECRGRKHRIGKCFRRCCLFHLSFQSPHCHLLGCRVRYCICRYNQKVYCLNLVLDFGLSYARRGELLDYIKRLGCFDNNCTRFYVAEVIEAVEYLHSIGIIHRYYMFAFQHLLLVRNYFIQFNVGHIFVCYSGISVVTYLIIYPQVTML